MKILKMLLVLPLVLGLMIVPGTASADSWWKEGFLPPGIQKKLDRGVDLPSGIWKKIFHRGEIKSKLVIKNIEEEIATTSAKISFLTKASSTATVYYGESKNLNSSSSSEVDSTFRTSHQIVLNGLAENTVYYYKIVVQNSAGESWESKVRQFRTLEDDEDNPVIEFLNVFNVGEHGATIFWVTDEKTKGEVWVGTSSLSTSVEPTFTLDTYSYAHSAVITNLNASTTYNYKVRSTDVGGNVVVSNEVSFSTR